MFLKLVEVLKDEATYRAHPAWNYSKLKWWVSHTPLSWRKKFLLGDHSEDTDNQGVQDGTLIDVKLLGNPGEWEEKYFVGDTETLPKPQGLRFAQKLHEIVSNKPQQEFIESFEEAYAQAAIKTPGLKKFTEDFEGSEIEIHYRLLKEANGRKVISLEELNRAEYASDVLRTDPNTKEIFSGDGFNQLPIVFEFEGVQFKILLDRLKIDHENKKIIPKDLKTSYSPQDFGFQYLKLGYYIQDCLYSKGVEAYRDEFYPDYEIEPFSFVTIDAEAFCRPLDWRFEFEIGDNPWTGFTHNNRPYRGIWTILSEITWHQEKDEWRIKKEHFDNKGKVTYKIC